MRRYQALYSWILIALAVSVGTLIATPSLTPLVRGHASSCAQAMVNLYNGDGLTGLIDSRCVAVGDDGVWVWSLDTYGMQNKVESAVYRTGSPPWADCFRFTLFDGTAHLSDVTLGLNRDYHLELPASLDNRADWVGVTGCT